MKKSFIKLYRGISAAEFNLLSDDVIKQNKKVWTSILVRRIQNNFKYPNELNRLITSLHKNLRLEYQYFTDTKTIAEGYAKKTGGILVELSVPLNDVLKYFDLEFQNFGRRKSQFEIVYCVKGSLLAKHSKRWKLKTGRKEE